jgi:transposase-like protein
MSRWETIMDEEKEAHDAVLKTRIALQAIRGDRTVAEIALEYGCDPKDVTRWKKQVIDEIPKIFTKSETNSD